MKLYSLITLLLAIIMLFFPFLSLNKNLGNSVDLSRESDTESSDIIIVTSAETGDKTEMDLKNYLIGVVAAEMPASYETEALKAQAVAAYSYQKHLKEKGNDNLTDSSKIHQGYLNEDERRKLWGSKFESYEEKVTAAVDSVFKEYLTYDGKTVPALYHALSPGTTESAENVFGNKENCLVSVTSPGDKLSPDYCTEKVCSKDEFEKLIENNGISLKGEADGWIEITEKLKSGYVKKAQVGDETLSGDEVRNLFSLNSPYFDVKYKNGNFTFKVYGKGHGVGMSQYSADYMARQGFSYKDILLHFYKDAKIVK